MVTDDIIFSKQLIEASYQLQRISLIRYLHNARRLIFQQDDIKLYQYIEQRPRSLHTPVLIVFATINRPDILDLLPHQSFIKRLLQQGIPVYLLDWGDVNESNQHYTFENYIDFLDPIVNFIKQKEKISKINLLGICQGGLFSLIYAYLYKNIKNIILISTPIDFHTRHNNITPYLNKLNFTSRSKNPTIIPGVFLKNFFITLRPVTLIGKKYLRFLNLLNDHVAVDKFLRVEKWLNDAPNQASGMLITFIKKCYQQNLLVQNKFSVGSKRIMLNNLKIPILNIMAKDDEIVPTESSKRLKEFITNKYYCAKFVKGGHIGIYLNPATAEVMAQAIAQWLEIRDK